MNLDKIKQFKKINALSQEQYGKHTLDDIKKIINLLPVLQELNGEMFLLITQKPHRIRKLLGKNYYWSEIYQYSLIHHVHICLESIGIREKIVELAQFSENAYSNLLEFINNDSNVDSLVKKLANGQIKSILATTYSLLKTVESIQIHGQSLNQLVRQVE